MTRTPVVFSFLEDKSLQKALCKSLHFQAGNLKTHTFPDEEVLITLNTEVKNKPVFFVLSTDRPNGKIMPLILAAETAKALGAQSIGLITPYLAYMRQDIAFNQGEGISSKYFAKLLSTYFDWLITVDPHLHRWQSLAEVFTIETTVVQAAPAIAKWIKTKVQQPILIGPDLESIQWVSDIAQRCDAPFLVVEKTRLGDEKVTATIPKLEHYLAHTPVLIDDIISTGMTMIETVKHIQSYGITKTICLGVHALFAKDAYNKLLQSGVTDIVTCNTIKHCTNQIDINPLLVEAVQLKMG